LHVTVRLPPPGLAQPRHISLHQENPVASIGKTSNAGPKVVTGVVVTVFLVFLFFGDRLGAISTGSHSPSRTQSISSLAL
jgi:hypothetical protein